MENRYACRLCRKIEINTDIYILKPIGYLNDAQFDENKNLIYINKMNGIKKKSLIPFCLHEHFIKSNKSLCYIDAIDYATLNQMIGETDLEKLFLEYVKDCEAFNYIIYFDKESKQYAILKFEIDELINFDEFLNLKDSISSYAEQNLFPIFINNDSVTISNELYKQILDYIRNDDIEALKPLLQLNKPVAMQTKDGRLGDNLCDLIDISNNKKQKSLIDKTEEEIIKDLNSLVGLDKIKSSIEQLKNHLKFIENSKEYIEIDKPNLNMIFTGNPGTGKTTVAKILSVLLNKIGLANEKIFECTAKDFIAEYVGQTAVKVHNLVQKAKGGILFIDEAYSFVSQGNSFAQDAFAEILKEMEKNETIFIFSGYQKEMQEFIKFNSGLASRIGYYFNFEDYNVMQLYEIFEKKVSKCKMVLDEECKPLIINLIDEATKYENFGNGRFVDKLFNNIIIQHANNNIGTQEKEKLITITKNDISENILQQILYKENQEKRIGFSK